MQLPSDFLTAIKELLGEETSAFKTALEGDSAVSIRLNPYKDIDSDFDLSDRVQWTQRSFYLDVRPDFVADPLWHGGAYYVQEASSMFLEQAVKQYLDTAEMNTVLDLCAAPGGKSTHLADLIGKQSLLVSNEVIKSRAKILSENIQKWGSGNVLVTCNDPKDIGKIEGFFDLMVVDAPCSGEGMFRKLPHSIKEWSAQNVKLCAARQKRILSDVWPALKPDGILIYSTCTYNNQENEENLDWLTEQFDAESLPVEFDAEWGVTERSYKGVKGYHFYPHKTRGEGFFIAVIRKTSGKKHKLPKKRKEHFESPEKKVVQEAEKWIINAKNHRFGQLNDELFVFNRKQYQLFDYLCGELYVIYAGTKVASITRKGVNPTAALALSTRLDQDNVKMIEVDQLDALRFLKQESISETNMPKGWYLITYKGLGLGWIKALGNRVNNYYPKEWRILMSWDKLKEKLQ
ncbi:MAG: rRNA methyltransferase [Aureispira sp.]|nr:rRNA methyltransferase [Aureispira sp.]